MFRLASVLEAESRASVAIRWYKKAADQGHVDAMFRLGDALLRRKERDEAEKWYRKADLRGHPNASEALPSGFDSQALTLLASQGVQDPLKLDTSWLTIAHVDEFVQFLPADNARGWTIAVADPRAGVEVLRTTQAAGHGTARHGPRQQPSGRTGGEQCVSKQLDRDWRVG
jgi:hypothetical protein